MSNEDSNERTVLTRKALARDLRRLAYKKAKERRASDPRMIAMKEAAKIRRREIYQQAKQRKKAAATAKKKAQVNERQRQTENKRTAADAELMKLIIISAKGSNELN